MKKRFKILNIRKGITSLALIASLIVSGLTAPKANAAEVPAENTSTYTEVTNVQASDERDMIFDSYIINYHLNKKENEDAPNISEYHNVVMGIYNLIANSEKNKEKPYTEKDILKAAIGYAENYFVALQQYEGKDNIQIPDKIGEIVYDVVPIFVMSYHEPTSEEKEKIAIYKEAVEAIANFYIYIQPTISNLTPESGPRR